MWRVGVGYRPELVRWIDTAPAAVECLEITAEHFFARPHDRLRALRERMPLVVHGLGLSLGTPGPLDEDRLRRFLSVVQAADPLWISEHVAFTRAGDIDLGHLNPVRYTTSVLRTFVDHVRELGDRCNRPVMLENIASHLQLDGELDEPAFLNELCAQAGCGLLLDVTNLAVNAHNHGYDAIEWLSRLEMKHIGQLHVVGYHRRDRRLHDLHADPIQADVFALVQEVLRGATPEAVILERDGNFPPTEQLADELRRLKDLRVTN